MTKTVLIAARFTPDEKQRLDDIAALTNGGNTSEVLRRLVRDARIIVQAGELNDNGGAQDFQAERAAVAV